MRPHRGRGIAVVGIRWVVPVLGLSVWLAFSGPAAGADVMRHGAHRYQSASVGRMASPAPAALTLANVGVIHEDTQVPDRSYTGYPVTVNTGCGNSTAFVCFNMAGLGAFTTTVVSPLQPGHVYSFPDDGALTVTAGGETCGEFQGTSGGYSAQMELDQFVFNQGISTFAAQFSCSNADITIGGTIAYNMANSTPKAGYYLYDNFGNTANFGNDGYLNYLGDPGFFALNQPIVGMATTPDGGGYWMTAGDGGVFSFGDAPFYGSTGNIRLNKPVVGMAATPDGKGYWFVASDGGIFTYGDAGFYGSTGNVRLNQPIVGMATTPDGKGYWLVASDGGIFSFGDAPFFGSTGNIRLNKPVVGMAATPDGKGYWFVASDGGIFSYGDAGFYGSTGNVRLDQPITGMLPSPDGGGYLLVADDAGVFAFGDAPFAGSLGGQGITGVIGLAR